MTFWDHYWQYISTDDKSDFTEVLWFNSTICTSIFYSDSWFHICCCFVPGVTNDTKSTFPLRAAHNIINLYLQRKRMTYQVRNLYAEIFSEQYISRYFSVSLTQISRWIWGMGSFQGWSIFSAALHPSFSLNYFLLIFQKHFHIPPLKSTKRGNVKTVKGCQYWD